MQTFNKGEYAMLALNTKSVPCDPGRVHFGTRLQVS